jgi:monooxygenase
VAEHFDVLIVGAGLSGIGAAVHLKRGAPGKEFAIFEARGVLGGTWDLFRYPGIRSDSDMFTLGYDFKPWKEQKAIADGPSILAYIEETAREHGIDEKIRFHHRVERVSWSSDEARWTVEAKRADTGEQVVVTAGFLWCCTGYYDYDAGYTPELPGIERFGGTVVHPQKWTDEVAYAGKRVVVIGSGATAMTLVPELAKEAAEVVMLQRSPTYVISRPAVDAVAVALRRLLPEKLAYDVTRLKNVILGMVLFELTQRRPEQMKRWLIEQIAAQLPGFDVAKHFTPHYGPWDQRLCLVPDGDLFEALRNGRASVVTDTIETFTERGVLLSSGKELEADLVVTATGLVLKFAGGLKLVVDGKAIETADLVNYKGTMFSDVPNLACTFGYTNASWTLKADLTADFVVRLLRQMDARGAKQCTPRLRDETVSREPFIGLRSGYVERALAWLPKQGSKRPWRLHQNYFLDIIMLRLRPVDDGALEFSAPRPRDARAAETTVERLAV